MKNKLLHAMVAISTITSNATAQNIQTYFSTEPFTAGTEAGNKIVQEFTDNDFVYGLMVIDQEVPYTCDEESAWDGFTIRYSIFTGKELKSGSANYNKVEIVNGKTYIYLDIYPAIEHAKSRNVKDFGYSLAKIEDGKNGKITFTTIEGKCYNLPKTNIKKTSFKYKFTGAIATYSELEDHIRKGFDKADKMRDDNIQKIRDKELLAKNEQDKLTGELPKCFNDNRKISLANFSEEQLIELFKTSVCLPENATYRGYAVREFEEKLIQYTNTRDYVKYNTYISYTDKDGNCGYRNVWVVQHFRDNKAESPVVMCKGLYSSNRDEFTSLHYYKCP